MEQEAGVLGISGQLLRPVIRLGQGEDFMVVSGIGQSGLFFEEALIEPFTAAVLGHHRRSLTAPKFCRIAERRFRPVVRDVRSLPVAGEVEMVDFPSMRTEVPGR